MTGKKNMVFGFFYLLLAMGLGLYITSSGHGLTEARLATLNAAFIHANIDSLLNILVGYLICRLPFVGWLSGTISVFMISGALFHSGVLYLAGFGLLPFALVFLPVGGVLIIAVLFFMGVGVLSLRGIR